MPVQPPRKQNLSCWGIRFSCVRLSHIEHANERRWRVVPHKLSVFGHRNAQGVKQRNRTINLSLRVFVGLLGKQVVVVVAMSNHIAEAPQKRFILRSEMKPALKNKTGE